MSAPRIFVSIASYRDSECQWTVKDLFEKARDPGRVFVGICWQYVPGEDDDCFLFRTRPDQVRVIGMHASQSRGACAARSQCQSLWRGEEFMLQIDSHMRFVEDWDDRLLAMLARCPSPKPVLSSYPASYTPPDQIDTHVVATMYARGFDERGVLKLHSRGAEPKDWPAEPQPSPFIGAGLLFAAGSVLQEVPYDPHLYFQGEEISLAVRLWTHGWDIFAPNQVLAWHDYTKRPSRKRHWNDNTDWTLLNERTGRRLRHLLGMEACDDPDALTDLDHYGLGTVRSLAEYEAFSRIDFRRRLICGRNADEVESTDRRAETRRTFTQIWRDNVWGSAETRSGGGSTRDATRAIRTALPHLFRDLGIRNLIDAGCGDMNWISSISGELNLYLGIDVVEEVTEDLRRRFGRRRGHLFQSLDIASEDLPACDAILCRDVLTHLISAQVRQALARFKASGSRFLIATTHPGRDRNTEISLGNWQPIDLTAAPFSLPPPRLLLSEELPDSRKSLGVWDLAEIPLA